MARFNAPPERQLCFHTPKKRIYSVDSLMGTRVESLRIRKALFECCNPSRRIDSEAFRTLDAPGLCDNYYCTLLGWSAGNTVAAALQQAVYLYDVERQETNELFEQEENSPQVTSLAWGCSGTRLAVGFDNGSIQVWDVKERKVVRRLSLHKGRVGKMQWHGRKLATGSKDRVVYVWDQGRVQKPVAVLAQHKQEVCGLAWAEMGEEKLATGGNDNSLLVWDLGMKSVVKEYSEHKAAVKAIAWSPHKPGLLASGGGSNDNMIKFWDTRNNNSNRSLNEVDCKSQVCNLGWSRNVDELVSTHGYSKNYIKVFKYGDNIKRIAKFTAHEGRVLHMAMSPDSTSIVTGSSDETIKFWKLFPKPPDPIVKTDGNNVLALNIPELR